MDPSPCVQASVGDALIHLINLLFATGVGACVLLGVFLLCCCCGTKCVVTTNRTAHTK